MTLSISDGNRTYTGLDELIEYAHEYCKNLPSHYGIDNIEDVELCHSVSMNNWYYRICLDGGNTYREEFREGHQVVQSDSVPREDGREFNSSRFKLEISNEEGV